MATLWKRATPSQQRILRAVDGAVRNTAHAHSLKIPGYFARSVAKRAAGTLTAQWPEVLAAIPSRQEGAASRTCNLQPANGSQTAKDHLKGEGLSFSRPSPIKKVWGIYKRKMWDLTRNGTPIEIERHIRILKLLAEAEAELEKLKGK